MENWWEHEEEQTPDAEQQAQLEQFDAQQKKLYRTGRILVYVIVGIHILMRLSTLYTGNFNLFGTVVTLLMAAGLIYGISWVRYIYIVGDVFSILAVVVSIPALTGLAPLPVGPVLVLALVAVYSAADIVLMAASKSIKEYMYGRRNG
ncbi:MAG: hypothetical protein NC337_09480 [Roseburia sp.]|nr:hypothetical protein [Roseburia sp.]